MRIRIRVRVASGANAEGVHGENAQNAPLFVGFAQGERHQFVETVVALVEPVAVLVRLEALPFGSADWILDGAGEDAEFLVGAQSLADVMVVDPAVMVGAGVAHEQGDGDRGLRLVAEHVLAFAPELFLRLLEPISMAAQIQDPDVGELVAQAPAEPVVR